MKMESYKVPVDQFYNWTWDRYLEVSEAELDKIIRIYAKRVMDRCEGPNGAMAMWAYFEEKTNNGGYEAACNAYRLLSGDNKTLTDREHELRRLFEQWRELWAIRYFDSYSNYLREKADDVEQMENSREKV